MVPITRNHEPARRLPAARPRSPITADEKATVRVALSRQEKTFRRLARETGMDPLRVRRACDEMHDVIAMENHAWLRSRRAV